MLVFLFIKIKTSSKSKSSHETMMPMRQALHHAINDVSCPHHMRGKGSGTVHTLTNKDFCARRKNLRWRAPWRQEQSVDHHVKHECVNRRSTNVVAIDAIAMSLPVPSNVAHITSATSPTANFGYRSKRHACNLWSHCRSSRQWGRKSAQPVMSFSASNNFVTPRVIRAITGNLDPSVKAEMGTNTRTTQWSTCRCRTPSWGDTRLTWAPLTTAIPSSRVWSCLVEYGECSSIWNDGRVQRGWWILNYNATRGVGTCVGAYALLAPWII